MSFGIQGVSNSPYITFAQGTAPSQPSTTQAPTNPFADPNGPFANLNLTATQQQQIAQLISQNSNNGTQTPTQLFSQVESVLTPQQQQTLQSDLETLKTQHHHHHHGSGDSASSATNPLSQLDLSSSQQSQISQILQTAQTNGTSSSDVLSQIDNVLTSSQQQQLVSLYASYTSTGSSPQTSSSFVLNTSA
jgi:Spy/CpxP family protein refolding chaperone